MMRKPEIVRFASVLIVIAVCFTMINQPAFAATTYTIVVNGKTVTVSTEDITHTQVINYHPTLDCHSIPVGNSGHVCCYMYTELMYKKLWGTTGGSNMLRSIAAADRKLTAANCELYLRQAVPGSIMRVGTRDVGNSYDSHTMLLLGTTSSGATFWEGNYNGRGTVRIQTFTWSSLVSYLSSKNYICQIIFPNAPEASTYKYTTLSTMTNWFYKIISGQGKIYKYPSTSSQVVNTLGVNSYVQVAAKVQTDTGAACEIWAKLSDGSFIQWDYLEYQYKKVSDFVAPAVCTQRTLKERPFADANDIRQMSGNESVTLAAVYVNKYNNTWYGLQGGGFINENNMTISAPTITASSIKKPTGTLTPGNTFGIRGVITTNTSLYKVGTQIIDLRKEEVVSSAACYPSPTATSVNLNAEVNGINVNLNTSFASLPVGYYKYQVYVQVGYLDGDIPHILSAFILHDFDSEFTVGSPSEPPPDPDIEYTPGDVTGDGNVNIMDVIRLLKYTSGWSVQVNLPACDVTGDGNINIMDVIRLLKYTSGWDVTIH